MRQENSFRALFNLPFLTPDVPIIHTRILKLRLSLGSGRAMVFYLGRLGSNPRTDLGFSIFSILAGRRAFSNNVQ